MVASTNNSVDEMDYYITESYTTGLFDSCKNVQLSFTASRAIEISCGAHSSDCTPHLWLEYMGGHDPSPYQINFHFETTDNVTVKDKTFYPMNETIVPCSEAVNKFGTPCSCVDCPCSPTPPPPPPPERKFLGLPLMDGIMALVYAVVATIIIGGFAYSNLRRRGDGKFVSIFSEHIEHPNETEMTIGKNRQSAFSTAKETTFS